MISVIAERGPDLAAVDDIFVTVFHGTGLNITQVRAVIGLRETLTPDFFAGQDVLDVPLAIFFRAHIEQ